MVIATLSDGRTVQGALHIWAAGHGYFQVQTSEGLVTVQLDEVEAADDDGDDLLERAARERMGYVFPT